MTYLISDTISTQPSPAIVFVVFDNYMFEQGFTYIEKLFSYVVRRPFPLRLKVLVVDKMVISVLVITLWLPGSPYLKTIKYIYARMEIECRGTFNMTLDTFYF
jgi:hypothetical protein